MGGRLPGRSRLKGEGGVEEMETAVPGVEFGYGLREEDGGAGAGCGGAPAHAWGGMKGSCVIYF